MCQALTVQPSHCPWCGAPSYHIEWYTTSSSRPWKRSRNGTGPSGPTTSTVPSSSTIGSRRRAAARASPSRVWAFSRTSSSSRAACQVARSTTGGRPGSAAVGSSGVVVMVSSVVSRAGQHRTTSYDGHQNRPALSGCARSLHRARVARCTTSADPRRSARGRRSVADHTAYLAHRHPVPRKLHHPPGGACRCVGRRIGAHRQRRDDVEGLLHVPSDLLANRGDLGDDLGELVRLLEVDREEPLEPA